VPDNEPDKDDSSGRSLHDLVRTGMHDHGWTYSDLERASGRALTRGRWQQLGAGVAPRKFPDPESLLVIAGVLEVDITTVVLAAARSVGLAVVQQGTNGEAPRRAEALLPLDAVPPPIAATSIEARPETVGPSGVAGTERSL
jgi:hypothetical protein